MHVVEMLNGLGRWLMGHLWQLSIELVVLAVVVMLAIFVLRIKSPALRHAFWGLVLIKPLVTVLVASPLSLYWFLLPPVQQPVPAAVTPPVAREHAETPPAVTTPARTEPATSEKAPVLAPAMTKLGLHGAIGLAWLVIASALGLRLLMGCAFVALLRHSATLQRDGPLHAALQEASRELKLRRRVSIATSGGVPGPMLTGILRPVILLPQHVAEGLSRRQIRMIVMHELVHVRRWDNLVVLVQRVAEMLLFFHPVIWLCGWMMRREAEAACDDAVLASTGGSELYADSLTRVAEMTVGRPPVLLASASATAESHFAHRVRRILDGGVGRMTIRVSIVSVIALVVVACLALPSGQKMTGEQQQVSAGLARRAELFKSFEGYVTMVRFYGPASEERSEPREYWPDFAQTRLYAIDTPHDRWLAEVRWHYPEQWYGVAHKVSCLNEGVYADKAPDASRWQVRSDKRRSDRYRDFLRAFFLRDDAGDSWAESLARLQNVTITEEEVDGAKCLRIDGELRTRIAPTLKLRVLTWVDPQRAFAVRRWAHVYYRLGRLFRDHMGRAYDFREYPGGLWLPQRTKIVRCVHQGEPVVRTWEELQIYEIVEGKVNDRLSQDFFAGLVFREEYPTNAYDAKLVDDDPQEVSRKEALLKQVQAGPGDPNAFVEPLAKLKAGAEEIISPARAAELLAQERKAPEDRRRAACRSNVKQLLLGLLMYCEQGNPLRPTWVEDISTYVRNEALFRCPSRQELKVGFALNQALLGLTLADIARPAETVLLFESNVGGDSPIGGARDVPDGGVHGEGINVGFADGHARWVPAAEAKKLLEASDESAQ